MAGNGKAFESKYMSHMGWNLDKKAILLYFGGLTLILTMFYSKFQKKKDFLLIVFSKDFESAIRLTNFQF